MLYSSLAPNLGKMLVKDADATYPNGVLEGYASVFGNVDHGGDVVMPGAFTKTLAEQLPTGAIKLYDSHQIYKGTEAIIGVVLEAKEDAYGLWFRAAFSSVQHAQDVRTKIKEGILNALSFGFDITKDSVEQYGEGRVRKIHEVKIYEISVVPWGMNPKAHIQSAKSLVAVSDFPLAPQDHIFNQAEALDRFKAWVSAKPMDEWGPVEWNVYSKGFMLQEGAETESAYRFPIVDVIDGKASYVLHGVKSARVEIGKGFAVGDRDGLVHNCNRLFKRFGVKEEWTLPEPEPVEDAPDPAVDELISKMNAATLEVKLASALASLTRK